MRRIRRSDRKDLTMELPAFISVEAILWAKDKAKGSIVAPNEKVTTANRKEYYADPKKIEVLVKKLKTAGFTVSLVGKWSISLMTEVTQIEEVFGVTILLDDGLLVAEKNGKKSVFIEAGEAIIKDVKNTTFSLTDILHGLLLMPAPQALDNNLPQINRSRHQVYPWELPKLLGDQPKEMMGHVKDKDSTWPYYYSGKGVKVAVIDNSLHVEHPLFKALYKSDRRSQIKHQIANSIASAESRINIQLNDLPIEKLKAIGRRIQGGSGDTLNQVDYQEITQVIGHILDAGLDKHINSRLDEPKKKDVESLLKTGGKTEEVKLFTKTQILGGLSAILTSLTGMETEFRTDLKSLSEEVATNDLTGLPSDPHFYGHGTAVLGSLLALAPDIEVSFMNIAYRFRGTDLMTAFGEVVDQLSPPPKIINCSWRSDAKQGENPGQLYDYWYRWVEYAVYGKKMIVIFSAGNKKNPSHSIQAYTGAAGAIIVGGAFKKGEDLQASNTAHGYQGFNSEQIPDLCGWCGEENGEEIAGILLPVDSKQGTSRLGTSFSAPQIAGACARILEFWPEAHPVIVKEILMKTATKVPDGSGRSAQNNPPPVATGAGMVNIQRALLGAEVVKGLLSSQNISDENNTIDFVRKLQKSELDKKIEALKSRPQK